MRKTLDFIQTSEFIIFDLEYTAWEGTGARQWSGQNEHREIIAVGAIKVKSESMSLIDELSLLVKPSVNSNLSPYIQELTKISDREIRERGLSLIEAMHNFADFVDGLPVCSYGMDGLVIFENLLLNEIHAQGHLLQDKIDFSLSLAKSGIIEESPNILPIYGSKAKITKMRARQGVKLTVEIPSVSERPKRRVDFYFYDIVPWVTTNIPRLTGRSSGELASCYSDFNVEGQIHDPMFDVKSILFVLKKISENQHIVDA